jgi:hypothetical protein
MRSAIAIERNQKKKQKKKKGKARTIDVHRFRHWSKKDQCNDLRQGEKKFFLVAECSEQ